MHYMYLAMAIIAEVIATTALKSSKGFTQPLPSLITVVGYGASFYLLSLCLEKFSVGLVYAVWSGVGIVLISLLAWLVHSERLDAPAIAGMSLIAAGIVVINAFSSMAGH